MRWFVSLLLSAAPLLAGQETSVPKGVDVVLVSENRSISPGRPFTVGLKIHHHPKFHTYWKNPGIAGVPTRIEWDLPPGFTAGPIQWPYPEKTLMSIHPVHGYERDVMLLVDITPPAEISSSTAQLKATATWMACADGCYPGEIALKLDLPVAAEAAKDPQAAEAFARARQEMPQPLDGWSAVLLSAPDAAEIRFRLIPQPGKGPLPSDLYFFSADGQVSSDPPQRVGLAGDGSVEFVLKRSKYGPKGVPALPGVLVSASPLVPGGPKFASIIPVAKP